MDVPENVWAIGAVREPGADTPIRTGEYGFAPLSVLDKDGERALPVFTTRIKAERGIHHFTTKEEREGGPIASVRVSVEDLLKTFRYPPAGAPKIDYIGVDMGEGGAYPLVRP